MDLDIPVRKPDFSHITDEATQYEFSILNPKDKDLVICRLYPDTLRIKEVWLHTEENISEPVPGSSPQLTHTEHDFVFLHPKHYVTVLRWARFGMEVVDLAPELRSDPSTHRENPSIYYRNRKPDRELKFAYENYYDGVALHGIKWLEGSEAETKKTITSALQTSLSDHLVTVWEHSWLAETIYNDVLNSAEDADVKKMLEEDRKAYLLQARTQRDKNKLKGVAVAKAFHRFNLDFEAAVASAKTPDEVLDTYEKITSHPSKAYLAPYEDRFWGLHGFATPGNVGNLANQLVEKRYYALQEARLAHSFSPFNSEEVNDHIAEKYGIANLDTTI